MEFSDEQWARLEKIFGLTRAELLDAVQVVDEWDSIGEWRDRGGWPISLGQALLLAADDEYRHVSVTELEVESIELVVSTVWLGWVYGPELFETMVFRDGEHLFPLQTTRYGSEEDARAGHREVVQEWSTGGGQACSECGAMALPRRKFNSGNPMTIWLPDCDCQEQLNHEYIERMIARNARKGPPVG